jgi:hypothetical protein
MSDSDLKIAESGAIVDRLVRERGGGKMTPSAVLSLMLAVQPSITKGRACRAAG